MAKNNTQMAISDFNMEKISTPELSDHIDATIKMNGNIAIFGARGTGKTMIAKSQIAKSGFKEVYINLSVFERPDLGGYPRVLEQKPRKFVEYMLPMFYEPLIEGNKGVVVVFDEVDKAEPALWAPLLELTQFRSINGTPLPNYKATIMTGNLIAEGGARPSLPLLDRAEKYLVEADAASWLEWSGKAGKIHPAITAYIYDHPKDLFGSPDPQDRYADPSPRGWARASEILHQGEAAGCSANLLIKKVAGCIGKDAGIKYSNYYEHYQVLLPLIEDLYQGKDVIAKYRALEPTKQLVGCMIACGRLANLLDKVEVDKKVKLEDAVKHMGKFLQKAAQENALIAVRTQISAKRMITHKLTEHEDWAPFVSKIKNSINF